MKNGQLEPQDSDTLMSIYRKLNIDGTLKEPLSTKEQVIIFAIAEWIEKNVKENE